MLVSFALLHEETVFPFALRGKGTAQGQSARHGQEHPLRAGRLERFERSSVLDASFTEGEGQR